MDQKRIDLLMKLQYDFPLTPTPFSDTAIELGVREDEVLGEVRRLLNEGIVKRIGFYYNYRAKRQIAALIALACGERYRVVAETVRHDPLITHSYRRDHPYFNLWIVARRDSRESLIRYAERLAAECESSSYLVLFSKKTLKLSVKYDLKEGVSRSGPYSTIAENPPTPQDLGVDPRIPEALRSLPIDSRPYKRVAEMLGFREEEVFESAMTLLRNGVLGDPGASLDGKKLGFSENAMIVAKLDGSEDLAECLASIPYTTHVVLREVYPRGVWFFDGYAMVHATSREKIYGVVRLIQSNCSIQDLTPLFSLEDLKPEAVR